MNEVKRLITASAVAGIPAFPEYAAVLDESEDRIYVASASLVNGSQLDNTGLNAIVLPAGSGRQWSAVIGCNPGMEKYLTSDIPVLKKLLPSEMATERKIGYHTAMVQAVRDIFASLGYVDGDLGMTASALVSLIEGQGQAYFDIDELFGLVKGLMEHRNTAGEVEETVYREPAATEAAAELVEIYYSSRYGASISVSGGGSSSIASLTSGSEAGDITSAFRTKNVDDIEMQLYITPETKILMQINGTEISTSSAAIFVKSEDGTRMVMPPEHSDALSRYVSVLADDMMAGISVVKCLVGMSMFYRQ